MSTFKSEKAVSPGAFTMWSDGEWDELEAAAQMRKVDRVVELVVRKGIHTLGPAAETPLFVIARGGTGASAKALVDLGVRAEQVSSDGNTALAIAVMTRNSSVAAVLKKVAYPRPVVERIVFREGVPSDHAGVSKQLSPSLLADLMSFFVHEFRCDCMKIGVKPNLPPNYQDAVTARYRKTYAPWVQLLLHEGAVSAGALFDATECACIDLLRDLIRGGHGREMLETTFGRAMTRSQFAEPVIRSAWKAAEKAAVDATDT